MWCRGLLLAIACSGLAQSIMLRAKPVIAEDLLKAKVKVPGLRRGFRRTAQTPEGWQEKTDQNGVTYFYHPEKRITTFQRPEMSGETEAESKIQQLMKAAQKALFKNDTKAIEEEANRKGEMGAFYLWVENEDSYGGANVPGESKFINANPGVRESGIFQGFRGFTYDEVKYLNHSQYVGQAQNWGVVPQDPNQQYWAGDHGQKAVAIYFSYMAWLEHIATLDPKGTYMIAENDMGMRGDWQEQLKHVHEEHPADADAIGLTAGGGWNKAFDQVIISCWAVPGADAAKRIIAAVKAKNLDCWDFDCILHELLREGSVNFVASPYTMGR